MVTVARLTRRKGHLTTVDALTRLPPAVRDKITWLMIGPEGEADYVNELKAAIAASGCNVRLMGALPAQQICDIYGACDFFCLGGNWDRSGRVEGFGLVFLEAAAGGLPSIATNVGGVADAVLPNQTGLLVEPNAEALGAAIAEMVNDGVKRMSLGKRAAARARTMNWERCAAGTYYLSLPTEGHAAQEFALPEGQAAGREASRSGHILAGQSRWVAALLLAVCCGGTAYAESCTKSLEYILGGPPASFRNRRCPIAIC